MLRIGDEVFYKDALDDFDAVKPATLISWSPEGSAVIRLLGGEVITVDTEHQVFTASDAINKMVQEHKEQSDFYDELIDSERSRADNAEGLVSRLNENIQSAKKEYKEALADYEFSNEVKLHNKCLKMLGKLEDRIAESRRGSDESYYTELDFSAPNYNPDFLILHQAEDIKVILEDATTYAHINAELRVELEILRCEKGVGKKEYELNERLELLEDENIAAENYIEELKKVMYIQGNKIKALDEAVAFFKESHVTLTERCKSLALKLDEKNSAVAEHEQEVATLTLTHEKEKTEIEVVNDTNWKVAGVISFATGVFVAAVVILN